MWYLYFCGKNEKIGRNNNVVQNAARKSFAEKKSTNIWKKTHKTYLKLVAKQNHKMGKFSHFETHTQTHICSPLSGPDTTPSGKNKEQRIWHVIIWTRTTMTWWDRSNRRNPAVKTITWPGDLKGARHHRVWNLVLGRRRWTLRTRQSSQRYIAMGTVTKQVSLRGCCDTRCAYARTCTCALKHHLCTHREQQNLPMLQRRYSHNILALHTVGAFIDRMLSNFVDGAQPSAPKPLVAHWRWCWCVHPNKSPVAYLQ